MLLLLLLLLLSGPSLLRSGRPYRACAGLVKVFILIIP